MPIRTNLFRLGEPSFSSIFGPAQIYSSFMVGKIAVRNEPFFRGRGITVVLSLLALFKFPKPYWWRESKGGYGRGRKSTIGVVRDRAQ